jgi:hypothetical protein
MILEADFALIEVSQRQDLVRDALAKFGDSVDYVHQCEIATPCLVDGYWPRSTGLVDRR